MSKPTFYGRRVLMIQNKETSQIFYRQSGQWVGHAYGNQFGTDRQRKNYYNPETENLLGVSEKIFWSNISEEALNDKNFTDSLTFAN
jgi:hypothetical protein